MSITQDFAAYLSAQGLVPAPWAIKIGVMPPDPDQVVALFATGGASVPIKRVEFTAPGLQIRVRGAKHDYEGALAMASALNVALHELDGTIGSSVYPWIIAEHEPLPLGYDDNSRPEFSLNFRTAREAA